MAHDRLRQIEDAESVWGFLERFSTSYAPPRPAFERDYPRLVKDEAVDLLAQVQGLGRWLRGGDRARAAGAGLLRGAEL